MILTLPKSPIREFFMGIAWLDPNVRYFRDLGKMQAQRTPEDMLCWQLPEEMDLALAAGYIFMRCAHWKKPYFFPGDFWEVMWLGPEPFSWFAMDSDLDIVDDIVVWLQGLGMVMNGREFGHLVEMDTFGEFVAVVLSARLSSPSKDFVDVP